MKTTFRLPILYGTNILVGVGDKIDSDTPIYEFRGNYSLISLEIAQLLHIKPSQISKYLKIDPGDEIDIGTILAQKRNLFSSYSIKSPIKGVFKNMDLKDGTITILESSGGKREKKKIPVRGKIIDISKSYIEVEAEGEVYHCMNGKGEDVIGKLLYFEEEVIGVLDINCEVEESIVMCRNILPESSVKLEVMGAVGLVSENIMGKLDIPWVQIEKEIIAKLKVYNGQRIWLSPKSRQIVTFN